MTRFELISAVAAETGVSKANIANVIDATFDAIIEGTKKDGRTTVARGVLFKSVAYKPRKVRNPKTGETMDIPGKTVVMFKQITKE